MDESFIVVITTCPTSEEAERIASALIDRRLAACVQENSVTSTYRWQGRVERDDEIRLMIKSTAAHFDDICKVVRELVSYDNPQIISLPIERGATDYLDWIHTETASDRK